MADSRVHVGNFDKKRVRVWLSTPSALPSMPKKKLIVRMATSVQVSVTVEKVDKTTRQMKIRACAFPDELKIFADSLEHLQEAGWKITEIAADDESHFCGCRIIKSAEDVSSGFRTDGVPISSGADPDYASSEPDTSSVCSSAAAYTSALLLKALEDRLAEETAARHAAEARLAEETARLAEEKAARHAAEARVIAAEARLAEQSRG
jgi:hypothetical protein